MMGRVCIAAWLVLAPVCLGGLAGEAGKAGEGPQTAPASQGDAGRIGPAVPPGRVPTVTDGEEMIPQGLKAPAPAATDAVRRLWLENIAPPASSQPSSQGLRRALAEVQRVALPDRRPGQLAATRPAGGQPAAGLSSRSAGSTTEPAGGPPATQPGSWPTTAPALPQAAMERLRALPASDPAGGVELADALFASGHLEAAFVAYERLVQASGEAELKAWALYQMANCRRQADPAAAEQLYQRVVREHASSPWAAAATAERTILEWLGVNRPAELLQSVESLMAPGGSPRPGPTSGPASRAWAGAASHPASRSASQPASRAGMASRR